MGLLSAFIGGAAGQGLMDYSRSEREREQREAELRMRAEEREMDRRARAELAREQIESRELLAANRVSAGSTDRGRRISGGELNIADIEAKADIIMRAQEGLTNEEIATRRGAMDGANPYRKPGDAQGSTAFGSFDLREGDEAALRKSLKALGGAQRQAISVGTATADDDAKAVATYRQSNLSDAVIEGRAGAGAVATGQAAAKGDDLFAIQGNTRLDTRMGGMTTTEVGGSEIAKNGAQAGEYTAGAGKKSVETKAITERGGVSPGEAIGLLSSYEAAAKRGADDVRGLERELARASGDAGKVVGEKARASAEAEVERVAAALANAKEIATRDARAADSMREQARGRTNPERPNAAGDGGANRKFSPSAITAERARANAAIAAGKSRAAVSAAFERATGQRL